MSELILAIIIACSLGVSGCTDNNSSGLQEDNKTKTEEKVKESEKKDEKKEQPKKETKKTETKQEKDEEIGSNRNYVIAQCTICDGLIHESDGGYKVCEGDIICLDCYNKAYRKCIDCGKTVNGYDEGVSAGSTGLRCKDCTEAYINDTSDIEPMEYGDDYGDYEYHCEDCGSGLNKEEVCYHNGKTLCPDCALGESRRENGLEGSQ